MFEKCVNEITDDVTLNPIFIFYQVHKSSYLGQFAAQTIETWQANSSAGIYSYGYKKFCSHGNPLFSSIHPLEFKMLVIFSSKH